MPTAKAKSSRAVKPAQAATPGDTAAMLRSVLMGIAILALTFLAYYPALKNGFIWDDDDLLTENPLIYGRLWDIWFSTKFFDYYPLTLTSLWIEFRCWGTNPAPYHFTNILLHAISAVVFWRVLLRLKIPGAWLAAAIFAVHPVTVESAAWIAERKNTLPMVFYAFSLLFFLRSQKETQGAQFDRWYWFSVFAFLLALLGKTSVVMLPFVLLGCVWWLNKTITRRDILRSIPFFALSLIFGLVTVWYQYNNAISTDVVQTAGFLEKLARAGWVVWFYLSKALLPIGLYLGYPRWQVDSHSLLSYVPGIALLMWLVVFWKFRESWGRPLLFALGYFIVSLFPVIGFFKIYFQKYSFVSDHWQYVPIIGIIALASGVAVHFLMKLPQPKIVITVFGVSVLGSLSFLTWNLCFAYGNEETLWRHTLRHNQSSWLAHHNLSAALVLKADFQMERGNPQAAQQTMHEAMTHLERTLELKPDHAMAHYNLAQSFMRFDRFDEARRHFQEAIRYDPDMISALVPLAWEYATNSDARRRNGKEAVRLAEHAAKVCKRQDPNVLDALAAAYAEEERFDEATKTAEEAIKVASDELDNPLATEISQRLRLYKSYRPYRE